jgi:hypothetical protein
MQDASVERTCARCLGKLRAVRQVPVLRSLEGQRIFECAECGLLTLVAPHETALAWVQACTAGLLILQ